MPADKIWEVVLVGPDGGCPVTEGQDSTSTALLGQLSKGTLVRQLAPPAGSRQEQGGRRLQFAKIAGDGPDGGWVTVGYKEQDFLARNHDITPEDIERLMKQPGPTAVSAAGSDGQVYDIVIYGATGFTGTLAVEHLDALLAERDEPRPRWALAGRDPAKLRDVAKRCRTAPALLTASAGEGLDALAASCRVLIAAAGPYQLCGEAAVKACVEKGAHYVDFAGETVWMHDMIAKYHEEAKKRGVMIVHSAGQVCTIDEITCYMLAQKLGPLRQFREYFTSMGAVTGGTFSTSIASMEGLTPERLKVSLDPFNLGGQRKCGLREADRDCVAAEKDPLYPSLWLQAAYSSHTAPRIIRRSCQLFEESPEDGLQYGEGISVTVREGQVSQKAAETHMAQNAPLQDIALAPKVAEFLRNQVAKVEAPKPGQGPPPAIRAMYYSDVYSLGEGENGEWAYVHYTGPEAYEVTAIACVTAALVLVEEADRVKPASRGGVLTPAFAMHGSTFVERLEARPFGNGKGRKMKFELLAGKPPEEVLRKVVQERQKNAMTTQAEVMQGRLKQFA